MTAGATYLADLAAELLEAATDAIDPLRTGHELPSRIFVSHGPPPVPPLGCEQLTVHLDAGKAVWVRTARSQPRVPETCQIAPAARFLVQLWRCWPAIDDGGEVPAAEYGAAAEGLQVDLWCLLTWIYAGVTNGDLLTDIDCKSITVGDARTLAPSVMAGWEIPVDVLLSDRGPADPS